jgi:hypothetical protein
MESRIFYLILLDVCLVIHVVTFSILFRVFLFGVPTLPVAGISIPVLDLESE